MDTTTPFDTLLVIVATEDEDEDEALESAQMLVESTCITENIVVNPINKASEVNPSYYR